MSETRIPEALALLREKGWCKNFSAGLGGEHCLVGAYNHVTIADHIGLQMADMEAIYCVLAEQYGEVYDNIPQFNDDPSTTFADVEFVLEKAILERGGAL